MRNRFKGLDATDRVPEELWTQVHDTVQEASPRKRNAKRQNGCLRRSYKQLRKEEKLKAKKKGKIYPCSEFERIARRDKKAFLSN